MAANTAPIFSRQGQLDFSAIITAANTAKDGTGTVDLAFTADATEGSWLEKLVFVPLGTNVVTVVRVFINNGSAPTSAGNNAYFGSMTLPATTNSETASVGKQEMPMKLALPPGYRIYITLGTAIAAGIKVIGVGGKF